MNGKILKSRIIHKHDIEANWRLATNFSPLQGEIIIYDPDENNINHRVKIGDGVTNVNDLKFIDDNKVDKIEGKGLSTNDYTTAEKNKLDGIATGANKTIVDSDLSATSTNPVQNKVVNTAISNLTTLVGDKSVASQVNTAVTTAKSYTDTKVAEMVDSAPETLNTLNELAAALGDDPNFATTVANQIGTKADANHTHNYAGSVSAGGSATSAVKLDTSAGSDINPVYFSNGKPVKTTYTLGASVPSGAKFTDTTYSNATTSTAGLMSSADKTNLDKLNNLVGDTAVSTQIEKALENYQSGSTIELITWEEAD